MMSWPDVVQLSVHLVGSIEYILFLEPCFLFFFRFPYEGLLG
jgi:hypothetical protein